jgi:hypothetical protein
MPYQYHQNNKQKSKIQKDEVRQTRVFHTRLLKEYQRSNNIDQTIQNKRCFSRGIHFNVINWMNEYDTISEQIVNKYIPIIEIKNEYHGSNNSYLNEFNIVDQIIADQIQRRLKKFFYQRLYDNLISWESQDYNQATIDHLYKAGQHCLVLPGRYTFKWNKKETCAICQESSPGRWCKLPVCAHPFHRKCIVKYVIHSRHPICPICRSNDIQKYCKPTIEQTQAQGGLIPKHFHTGLVFRRLPSMK